MIINTGAIKSTKTWAGTVLILISMLPTFCTAFHPHAPLRCLLPVQKGPIKDVRIDLIHLNIIASKSLKSKRIDYKRNIGIL